MARKVFLSILGTGYYEATRYYFDDYKTNYKTRFIQEATIKHFCSDWNEEDKIVIFLTEKARKTNWNDPAQVNNNKGEYIGLSKILEKYPNLVVEDIPDGNTENEIWKVFQTIYNHLDENAEVYFDITHAFRFLPMLLMVLINYAKLLKNISVKSVTYGNYEAREKHQDGREYSPVMKITPLSELQDWTNSINSFLKHGSSLGLKKLINKEYEKSSIQSLKQSSNKISEFTEMFSTLRGKKILEGKIPSQLQEQLKIVEKKSDIAPLSPLINALHEELQKYSHNNDSHNGLNAIEWCIDHDLIQQAATLMQEMIVSIIIENRHVLFTDFKSRINNNESTVKNLNKNKVFREYVGSILGIVNTNKANKNERRGWAGKEYLQDLTEALLSNDKVLKFEDLYKSISRERNSLNHGGMIDNIKSTEIKDKIKEHHKEFISLFYQKN